VMVSVNRISWSSGCGRGGQQRTEAAGFVFVMGLAVRVRPAYNSSRVDAEAHGRRVGMTERDVIKAHGRCRWWWACRIGIKTRNTTRTSASTLSMTIEISRKFRIVMPQNLQPSTTDLVTFISYPHNFNDFHKRKNRAVTRCSMFGTRCRDRIVKCT